jgi:xylulokinase
MLFIGIDIGTSSVKVSIIDAQTQKSLVSTSFPEQEAEIIALKPGWAEQSPDTWWEFTQKAILKANATGIYNPKDITAIGIAYQMHGLVIVDKQQNVLRNSIIWCDSRAVEIGEKAFGEIGIAENLTSHLNSPGNFTAAKLAWVKASEPSIYDQIDKVMLPGDYIAMRLTGEVTTSICALSEGIFWDFKNNQLSELILNHFGFSKSIFPEIQPVFSNHGKIKNKIADELGLSATVTITYKSGDQPNNALSLNVLNPGEVAATAGTSGVIYGVSDQLVYDNESRINTFAHVNYLPENIRTGVLLCINGTGILNSWSRNLMAKDLSYNEINQMASAVNAGSNGLRILPFGNGAERMLNNKVIGAHFNNIDLNQHTSAHMLRAVQEGIAFSFRYGLDIMRENGLNPSVIRAGKANLFLSDVFLEAFVGTTNVPVELYLNDGSTGAALGAGIGLGYYKETAEAFANNKQLRLVEPLHTSAYEEAYQEWKELLIQRLNTIK